MSIKNSSKIFDLEGLRLNDVVKQVEGKYNLFNPCTPRSAETQLESPNYSQISDRITSLKPLKSEKTVQSISVSNEECKQISTLDSWMPVQDNKKVTKRRGKKSKAKPIPQLTDEEMEREKQMLKEQYGHPPECNDFIIIYEKSKKFDK